MKYIFYEHVRFWLELFAKIIAFERAPEVAGAQSNWKLIMLTRNFVSSIRKLSQIQETKKLKKSVTDKTIYQNTNCCVNIQKRVSKTEMIYKYYVANNGRFSVYSHQKYISHNNQRNIVRN